MTGKARRAPLSHRIAAALLYRLWQLGIRLRPLIETREDARPLPPAPTPQQEFAFVQPTEADIEELVALGSESNREEMLQWLRGGKLCFGLRDGANLVANMWCDLDEVNFAPVWRKLAGDEAYLFAAYTDPRYRGHDLATRLRRVSYAELRARGRTRLCSYSELFNPAARRFKLKLGAVEERLCVNIDLFGRWSRTLTVWRYPSAKKWEADL
jgi:GNAT superfamily N-acetyltransferase